jgi:hypothetical protein
VSSAATVPPTAEEATSWEDIFKIYETWPRLRSLAAVILEN